MYQGFEAEISGLNAGHVERTKDHLVVNTPEGGALSIVTPATPMSRWSIICVRNTPNDWAIIIGFS